MPPPPPKFWTVSRCEQVLHVQGDDGGVTIEGYGFHVGLRVCVGMGGPQACEWTSGRRSMILTPIVDRQTWTGGSG